MSRCFAYAMAIVQQHDEKGKSGEMINDAPQTMHGTVLAMLRQKTFERVF